MVDVTIKQKLSESRMTIKDLAEKSGIDRIEIMRIVRGQSDPTLSTLQNIARTLGVGVADLCRDSVYSDEFTKIVFCPYCGGRFNAHSGCKVINNN